MGWFSNKEKAPKKNVEIIEGHRVAVEQEIEKRIEEGRIIKDIKIAVRVYDTQALIIYDSWAEKARAEKEKEGLGR